MIGRARLIIVVVATSCASAQPPAGRQKAAARESALSRKLWLKSSGALRSDGALLLRDEARAIEAWFCTQRGHEDMFACRARSARHRIRDETNATLRRELLSALPRRPTDAVGRKQLVEQAQAMRSGYCAAHPPDTATGKRLSICAEEEGTLTFLTRHIKRLGLGLRNQTAGLRRDFGQLGRAIFGGQAGPSGAFIDGVPGANATHARGKRRGGRKHSPLGAAALRARLDAARARAQAAAIAASAA